MLPSMTHAAHFIGNQWVSALSGDSLPVFNPSNGERFAQIARGNRADIDAAVTCGRQAFSGQWGHLNALERGRLEGEGSGYPTDSTREEAERDAGLAPN
jgi:aldehyde dehydrogenase (NAD+)